MSPRLLHLLASHRTPFAFARERDDAARREAEAGARPSPVIDDDRHDDNLSPIESSDAGAAPPSLRAMLAEIAPLVGVIPVAGPPVILLAGPWILFALLVAGPVALLITILLAMVAAALLVFALAAIVASPYLLVRNLRSAWARRATSRMRVPQSPANSPARADVALLPKSVSAAGS